MSNEGSQLPLVTVVTVTFNAASTFERAARSVLEQDYANIEYVVVDGGSRDGTVDIIRRYESRLGRWVSEPDRGISDAFNKGVALSKGDFITFVNADDWMSPGQISAAVAAFAASPQADFVFGDVIIRDGERPVYRLTGRQGYRRTLRYRLDPINHQSLVARRSLFDDLGGFDLSYTRAMDVDWVQRVDAAGRIGIYNSGIVGNFSQGGVSHQQAEQALAEVRRSSIANYGNFAEAWAHYLFAMTRLAIRRSLHRWVSPAIALRARELANPAFHVVDLTKSG